MSDQGGWAAPGSGSPPPDPSRPTAPPPPPGAPPPGWAPPPPGAPPPGAGPTPWGGEQWAGWSGSPTTQPGVIPLRPLGVGEILDGAITTLRRYPRATLGLAAVAVTISQVLQLVVVHFFARSVVDVSDAGELGVDTTGSGAVLVALAFGFVTNVVLTGALTVVVGQAVLGRPIDLAQVWAAVRSRFWALVGAATLVLLLDLLAAVLLVVPFFVVWPALSLATPALMLERQSVRRAISRSVALVRGQLFRCLGVVLLAWLIKSVVGSLLATPFALAGGGFDLFGSPDAAADLGTGYLLMSTLGAIVSGTVVAPFSAGVTALLYVDRRMRAEGLDVTLAAQAAAPQPAPPGGG